MRNIFERAYDLANEVVKTAHFDELFEPIEADREVIIAKLKTAMLTGKSLDINGTETVRRYSDSASTIYEDTLNVVAKHMGELV
jgi:hypothetical protein